MSRTTFLICLALSAAAYCGVKWPLHEGPAPHLPGDCPYYAAATQSLYHDGDLDLANQLAPNLSGDDFLRELRNHNSFYAVAPDGRIVPKLSILMSVVALPFYALFGTLGFLVFNLLQLLVLAWGIVALAGESPSVRRATLFGCLASPFMPYSLNFSPDIFGAVLVVGCYYAATRHRWLVCGLLAGLAFWAKIYLAPIIVPAGLLVFASDPGLRTVLTRTVLGLLGAVLGVAPVLILNTVLYGSPGVTGYDLEGHVTEDLRIVTLEHYSRFNQPILGGLWKLLFDTSHRLGAVWTAPLWALWPLGAWVAWRPGHRLEILALIGGIVINFLIFAPYDMWDAFLNGNRFLFPAFALGLALQGPLWESVGHWWTNRRRSTVNPS